MVCELPAQDLWFGNLIVCPVVLFAGFVTCSSVGHSVLQQWLWVAALYCALCCAGFHPPFHLHGRPQKDNVSSFHLIAPSSGVCQL
jgi:hypothetical protein